MKMDAARQTTASWLPAIAATLIMVLVEMDLFMTPIATTALVQGFDTNSGMVQAAIALFSLVLASLCILGGKLGDIHGKKRVFVIGLVLYGISALITALSPSMLVMIAGFSVLRAVAVALAVPASVALIIANYDDTAQRGKAFALYGFGMMVAGLLAPLLMGFMADKLSWRIPFALEVPVVLVALVLARHMRETETVKVRVDVLGTVLAFLGIGAIVLGGILGGPYGWWDARRPFAIGDMAFNPLDLSPAAVLFAIAVLFIALLLNHVNRKDERGESPLFSMKLFDNRPFAVATVMAGIFFMLNGALPFVVPVFLLEAVGFDGAQTGAVMMVFMLGAMVASLASGQLVQRMQPRALMQLAMMLVVAGFLWLFVASTPSMTVVDGALPMLVVGLGFGVVVTQIPNVQLSALPAKLQGEGSGLAETTKAVGVGLGTAVIGSVMFGLALGGMVDKVATQVEVEITEKERSELIVQIEDETVPEDVEELVAEKAPNLEDLTREAYVEAFQTTLGVLMGVVLLALLVASFIPRVETEAMDEETRMAAQAEGRGRGVASPV
jgi:MFS family permease